MNFQAGFMPLEVEVEEGAGRGHVEAADHPEEADAQQQPCAPAQLEAGTSPGRSGFSSAGA